MFAVKDVALAQSRRRIWSFINPTHVRLSTSSISDAQSVNNQNMFDGESSKFVSFLDEVDKKMANNCSFWKVNNFSTVSGSDVDVLPSSTDISLSLTKLILDGPTSSQLRKRTEAESANLYDVDIFEQYKDIMNKCILSTTKRRTKNNLADYESVVKWLMADSRIVEHSLSLMDTKDSNEHENKKTDHTSLPLRSQLQQQQDKFISLTSLTPRQMKLATAALTTLAGYCARRNQVLPLIIAWEKIKESGTVLTERLASTFLYVFGNSTALYSTILLGSSSVGDFLMQSYGNLPINRPSSVSEILTGSSTINPHVAGTHPSKVNQTNIPAEVATYHDLLYKPTERSISIRVKALVAKGDAHGAQVLLDSFPTNDEARLRTYLPIFKLHCEQGDVAAAFALLQKMRSVPNAHLESENYVLFIATVAENGYFRPNSPLIDGLLESTPDAKIHEHLYRGPNLFDFLLSHMADDVMEITSASARRLHNSLLQGFRGSEHVESKSLIHSFTNMKHDNEPAKSNELIVSRVAIDGTTAICPKTDLKLPLILLTDSQKAHLRMTVFKLSNEQHNNLVGNKTKSNLASEELVSFDRYLDSRQGQPFTVIIDGANVAYYMQNFEDGKFNWYQIQFMVNDLIKKNENPLVIVPSKYCRHSFNSSTGSSGSKQYLQPKEKNIINSLMESGRLYCVPSRVYDDYHWILASISDQTTSRMGIDLHVPTGNANDRWPGTRPMIITNDQLHDLKIEMLEPRLFRRWFSSHIVNYSFTAFVDDECVDDDICFSVADFFSREITRDQSEINGTTWHIPVSDWELNDRLCLRLPLK